MPDIMQIFALLFLMLGPFKIIGPFVKITRNADPVLTRKIAVRAILYSIIALAIAGILGEGIMEKYGIPVQIVALSGGIILFLYALLNVLHQFVPAEPKDGNAETPTMAVAMSPLAFPTIVTPYGIAAVIVFFTLSPDIKSKLMVGVVVIGIMLLNLITMIYAKPIFKTLAVILGLLGAILGVIQVALGAKIIYNSLTTLLAST